MKQIKEETIVEHLTEFRQRCIWVLVCFFLTFCLSFFQAPRLYQWLTASFDQRLLVLGPDDIFWIYLQLASLMAFTVSLPFLTYQVWAYVRPALEVGEGRPILIYIPAVFVCFVLGLGFGFYLVTPALLDVLLSLGEDLFETQLTAKNYLEFVLHTTLPVAILFELPVFVAFLTEFSIIGPGILVKYRRYAYFGLLCLAVLLTPANFISDLTMMVPLFLLYELSLGVSYLVYKKKKRGVTDGNLT